VYTRPDLEWEQQPSQPGVPLMGPVVTLAAARDDGS
jgi:hypothetical protein